jgi:hypothetical protein
MGLPNGCCSHAVAIISNFFGTNIPNPVMQSLLNPNQNHSFLTYDAEIIYYSQFFDTELADNFFMIFLGSKMILEYLEKIHPQPRLTALFEMKENRIRIRILRCNHIHGICCCKS